MNTWQSALVVLTVLTLAVGGVTALARFFLKLRVNATVSGASGVLTHTTGRPVEAFVLYIRSNRDHPVKIGTCSIYGQDTRGDYWRISVPPEPWLEKPITKGVPYRWEMPFRDVANVGLDVRRRAYGFARLAQPATIVWSRRMTAGPQHGTMTRSMPRPVAHQAGQYPLPPPWWVRWFK